MSYQIIPSYNIISCICTITVITHVHISMILYNIYMYNVYVYDLCRLGFHKIKNDMSYHWSAKVRAEGHKQHRTFTLSASDVTRYTYIYIYIYNIYIYIYTYVYNRIYMYICIYIYIYTRTYIYIYTPMIPAPGSLVTSLWW